MKIEVTADRVIVLKEVFSGVLMETSEGNQIGICMRDDTFEINVIPKGCTQRNWHRVNMQTATIEKDGVASSGTIGMRDNRTNASMDVDNPAF